MARPVRTRAQLRAEILQRADMKASSLFVDTSANGEVDRYINSSIHALWDLMITALGPKRVQTSTTIALTGATDTYNLPDEFYVPLGVFYQNGSDWLPVEMHTHIDRYIGHNSGQRLRGGLPDLTYRFSGTISMTTGAYQPTIEVSPDTSTGNLKVFFIPHAPILDDDADVWDGFNGWEEWVVVDVAAKLLEKEESDPSPLLLRRREISERILAAASLFDAGRPELVTDTERHGLY